MEPYYASQIANHITALPYVIGLGFFLLSIVTGGFLWAIFTKLEEIVPDVTKIYKEFRLLVVDIEDQKRMLNGHLRSIAVSLAVSSGCISVLSKDRSKYSLEILEDELRDRKDSEGLMLVDALNKRLNPPPKKRRKKNEIPTDSPSVS